MYPTWSALSPILDGCRDLLRVAVVEEMLEGNLKEQRRRCHGNIAIGRIESSLSLGIDLAAHSTGNAGADMECRTHRHGSSIIHFEVHRDGRDAQMSVEHTHGLIHRGRDHAAVRQSGSALVVLADIEGARHVEAVAGDDAQVKAPGVVYSAAKAPPIVARDDVAWVRCPGTAYGHRGPFGRNRLALGSFAARLRGHGPDDTGSGT